MAHVTLYLDDETASRLRAAAEGAGVSQSRWVARIIGQRLASDWPASVRELAGAWPDLQEPAKLRTPRVADTKREAW